MDSAGVAGGTNGTVLNVASNWSGRTALPANDDYIMNLAPAASLTIDQVTF